MLMSSLSSSTPKALLRHSALELAALIRHGEVTSPQVVEAHIQRAQTVNPRINAIIADRYAAARREAREKQAAVDRGDDLPPLHGVPCTIKEMMALQGAPYTGGSLLRRHVKAARDATAVARVRAAGAIPLGTTNASEMAMWMESYNLVHGRTSNPYDASRIPGGSSGGEGAIVGSGASPFGVGSDIGGSIRIPSFFCGVFGHKSTGGLVPMTGQYPYPEGELARVCTVGPLCRRAADLMPLLRIMAGPDGQDQWVVEHQLGDPASMRLDGLRVLVCDEIPFFWSTTPEPELRAATWQAARALERRGARVERWCSEYLSRAFLIWGATLKQAGGPDFHEVMGEGGRPGLAWELLRWAAGRPRHTLPALGLSLVEKILGALPQADLSDFVEQGRLLRRELEQLLEHRGLLIIPPHPRPAPRHNTPLLRPLDWIYTAVFNAMQLPVTAVPMGLGSEGLPLGVQVVGSRFADHVTIAGAMALEEEFGGWVAPF